MTIGAIAWDDTVLPFQLDRSDIRGRVARLDGVLEEVLKQHDYPPVIEARTIAHQVFVVLRSKPNARRSGALAGWEPQRDDGLTDPLDFLDADDGENWTRAVTLMDTVEDMELIGPTVSPTELLVRLFHEEQPRVFDANQIRFGCTCGEDKVRQSLSIYSAKDIATMTTDEGNVTADCQFCGAHYVFDPKSLGFEAEGDDA